jgi:glycosyltransferase involved in cell wall biosynthesis
MKAASGNSSIGRSIAAATTTRVGPRLRDGKGAERPKAGAERVAGLRVLQGIGGGGRGGAELQFTRLALALGRAGLNQRLLVRRDPERTAMLRAGGADPLELPFGGILDLATRLTFRREIGRFDPDVVLTWMNRATAFCPHPAKRRFAHVARLGGYYDLRYYRRCDHLIANTEDIAAYVRKGGWPAEKVHYLPNFVDSTLSPAVPRSQFDTPGDAPLLLALGRLHVNKAFDVLLDALAMLPEAWLWLAGSGPLEGQLKAQAARLGVAGRVRFLGWRDDLPALAAAADLIVVPSRHEPLGNVVLEAWAQRRPLVAAASQGPAALIRDQESGLLVPVEDAGALAAAIRRVITEPGLGGRLVEGGWAAHQADFTEAISVARYMELFERLARERRGG